MYSICFQPPLRIDQPSFDFDALADLPFTGYRNTIANHMAALPNLASGPTMNHQTLHEDHHHLASQTVTREIFEVLSQVSGKAEAATDDTPMALESAYQPDVTVPEVTSMQALEVDHIHAVAPVPNVHEYITFNDPGGEYNTIEEAQHMLNEDNGAGLTKHSAPDTTAAMATDSNSGDAATYPEGTNIDSEAERGPNAIDTEQAPIVPVIEHAQPVIEPSQRVDNESVPVPLYHDDSTFAMPDDAISTPAPEGIKLNDSVERTPKEAAPTVKERLEMAEPETTPAETAADLSEARTLHLKHIQVVESSELTEAQTIGANDGMPRPVEIMVESTAVAEEGSLAIVTEDQSTLPSMDVEPISTISTEFAIENDPVLEAEATPIAEDISAPIDPPAEPDPAPLEVEAFVTTTTTVTTVVHTEPEPETEQPGLGAETDTEADVGDDQAEHTRRAEQTRLEQIVEDATMQQADTDAPETRQEQSNPEAPATNTATASLEVEQGLEVTAGATDSLVVSEPTLNQPNGESSAAALQYSIALDTPRVASPPKMIDRSKSPEWQGFAALGQETDPSSPEPADHSSDAHEESPGDPETKDASTHLTRKRRLIMEVVIPVPSKRKGKAKAENVESSGKATRGRPKSRPTVAARLTSTSKSTARSRSSTRRKPTSVSLSSAHRSSAESTPEKGSVMQTHGRDYRRPLNTYSQKVKKLTKPAATRHIARSAKVEVVLQKRPGLLRRTGSIPSGNNVKFAPNTRTSKKRKAESELEDEPDLQFPKSEADAEEYEDVEENEEPESEPEPKLKTKQASKVSPSKPAKRPRRSLDARKPPTKLPEVLTGGRPKKRRVRR